MLSNRNLIYKSLSRDFFIHPPIQIIHDKHMMSLNKEIDPTGGISMSDGKGYGFRNGFALIVVLFILLIIVGASWF